MNWFFKKKPKPNVHSNNDSIIEYKLLSCGNDWDPIYTDRCSLGKCSNIDKANQYGSDKKEGSVVWAEYCNGKFIKYRWDILPNKKKI